MVYHTSNVCFYEIEYLFKNCASTYTKVLVKTVGATPLVSSCAKHDTLAQLASTLENSAIDQLTINNLLSDI